MDRHPDIALLDFLVQLPSKPHSKFSIPRRDAALDPLLIAIATATDPHITRNHYHHDWFPAQPVQGAAPDPPKPSDDQRKTKRMTYVSRQAPRKQRLSVSEEGKENDHRRETEPLKPTDNLPPAPKKRRPSVISPASVPALPRPTPTSAAIASSTQSKPVPQQVEVKCMARTRIPTPHGPVFLHLYHNNRDNKEHLALVVDPAQLSDDSAQSPLATPIRSHSLDAVWSDNETEMDRIIRGAYVGRLSSTSQNPSKPVTAPSCPRNQDAPAPLIRIHSECFTGETIGSMRCDCGEQLDEAIRQISQPISLPTTPDSPDPRTIPGRGAVIYLRQEGRGIGLLSKIRAYNLQDMGHDTVTANLMLGHKADERGYEIAAAILRDLGLAPTPTNPSFEGVRILTNNPDKVEALEKEGVHVVERVPMIPRSWQQQHQHPHSDSEEGDDKAEMKKGGVAMVKPAGATLIGGGAVHGEDLNKYLRTKVLRMGHMLPLWMEGAEGTVG